MDNNKTEKNEEEIKQDRKIEKIILHCSGASFGNAASIDHLHRNRAATPFNKIGYHWVICNGFINKEEYDINVDGLLETGRANMDQGAHCLGHNEDSIGICLVGESGDFSTHQYRSLSYIISSLQRQFPAAEIMMHSDLNPEKPHCPGIKPSELIKYLSSLNG